MDKFIIIGAYFLIFFVLYHTNKKPREWVSMAIKKQYIGFDDDTNYLQRIFQSANINFLIGSGASNPAIQVLGSIEDDLQKCIIKQDADKYYDLSAVFLTKIWDATSILLNRSSTHKTADQKENVELTRNNYKKFISALENILIKRRTGLLPRRANIFTTNYDLFIEDAATNSQGVILNDGFNHRTNINNTYLFDPKSFYRSVRTTGNLYNYSIELPTINLIKLHGSLSWSKEENDVYYKIPDLKPADFENNDKKKLWVNQHALVLPRKEKFKETVLENIYYDLLRTYSNELDKEGTLLIAFGFSFSDEHIELLTKKALRNVTLKLLIFAYEKEEVKKFDDKFKDFSNVEIIYMEDKNIDLEQFSSMLQSI